MLRVQGGRRPWGSYDPRPGSSPLFDFELSREDASISTNPRLIASNDPTAESVIYPLPVAGIPYRAISSPLVLGIQTASLPQSYRRCAGAAERTSCSAVTLANKSFRRPSRQSKRTPETRRLSSGTSTSTNTISVWQQVRVQVRITSVFSACPYWLSSVLKGTCPKPQRLFPCTFIRDLLCLAHSPLEEFQAPHPSVWKYIPEGLQGLLPGRVGVLRFSTPSFASFHLVSHLPPALDFVGFNSFTWSTPIYLPVTFSPCCLAGTAPFLDPPFWRRDGPVPPPV
ncbi:hypothetical protein Cob_v004868 [Colletotrichum orbiculare MAFF 240422]|uniref:Uncharacterized protein n=1 Tax=Colletotrichum orbiculare (strain 104-T / ATCC 96160 / CBS 514.97 / LARS 414 / MAFF 240422) TaxID=1213857 RepID=A0A484FUP9_COLOR|nr:hypothetical protein Cob_v004868 [Colletotrichum orbiculare MAFF 240422]